VLDLWKIFYELVNRAIGTTSSQILFQTPGDCFAVGSRIARFAVKIKVVRDGSQGSNVERNLASVSGENQYGARRSYGVTQTEFVKYIGIGSGEVGNGVIAQEQSFKHGLVYDSARYLLVGTQWPHAGLLDGWND
jgi:hypothetical protein